MKRELLQASNESKRLTEKLRFLEEENKKLGVVASRLGGQDARRIKAEVRSTATMSHGFQNDRSIGTNSRVSKSK